jgi:hypothetical protein
METSSSIEPTFIKLMGGRVVIIAFPVENQFGAWVEQTQTQRHGALG